jgi:hypothetical protein
MKFVAGTFQNDPCQYWLLQWKRFQVVPLLAKDTVLFFRKERLERGGYSSAQVHKKTFGATQYPSSLGQNFSLLFRPFGRLIRDKVVVGPRYKARQEK